MRGADSILQRLTAWVSTNTDKITDFNIGSATRTLLESTALQIEEYYYDLKQAVEFAIRNAAYHAFGFERTKARKATGSVSVFFRDSLTRETVIPKGTQFHTGKNKSRKIYFQTTENIVIQPGTEVAEINVECMEYGEIGNVYIGEITKLAVGNPNVAYITNVESFIDGRDRETELSRQIRFAEYVHTLQRGTAESIAYGIKQTPGVAGVWIDDSHIGIAYAYVHDKDGNLSDELKEKVHRSIEEYRSGGIEIAIRPVVKRRVDLDIKITYREGVDAKIFNNFIRTLTINYMHQLKASEDLYMSNLVTTINDTYRDVVSYISICNNADVEIMNNEIIRPGDILVNGFKPPEEYPSEEEG